MYMVLMSHKAVLKNPGGQSDLPVGGSFALPVETYSSTQKDSQQVPNLVQDPSSIKAQ